tara:strand:- start:10860 stop:11738 length:879 start_codon:yes stop_codon:yes gene_type:complete
MQVKRCQRDGTSLPVKIEETNAWTFAKAQDACHALYWASGKYAKQNREMLLLQSRYFGSRRPLNEITTEVIDEYIEHLKTKQNNSDSTCNRKLACLSKVLRLAHEQGRLEKMPILHRQREGKGRIRFLTDDEEALILQTLRLWGSNKLADAIEVLIDTGLRKGELLKIKKNDISKEGLYVSERKGNSHTVIPLTARAKRILENYARQSNTKEIFHNYYSDTTWQRLRGHLGLDDVTLHVLRHTCCSRLVQGGVPLIHVKEWMGHKSISTTIRYAHLAPKDLVQGLQALENRA